MSPNFINYANTWCTLTPIALLACQPILTNHTPLPLLLLKYENVFLQTSLEKNPSNLSSIFLLYVNFESLTIGLHVLIIYILHTCKISRRPKINIYVINQMFKFQVFVI